MARQAESADSLPVSPDSETGRLILSKDWSQTALGPISGWPQSLRTAVAIVQGSRFPMGLLWGPERVQLYNDAYVPIFGRKHPASLGQRAADSWAEIWSQIDPMFTAVEQQGLSTWSENQLMLLDKRGSLEECYFTFSYSPLRGENGAVEGVFVSALETTEGVVALRRQRTLQQLSLSVPQTDSEEAAVSQSATAFCTNPEDLPFALVYLRRSGESIARRVVQHRVEGTSIPSPSQVQLGAVREAGAEWPLEALFAGAAPQRIRVPGAGVPGGEALLLPIRASGQSEVTGVLIAGLSPQRPFDEAYRHFLVSVAEHLGASLAGARALRKVEAERIAILERMEDGFYAIDRDFRVTYANAATEHYLGRPREEIVGRLLWELIPTIRSNVSYAHFERAMREQVPVHFESPGIRKAGTREVHAYPSSEGLSIFFRDLTLQRAAEAARLEAEKQLRESEQRYRTVFKNNPLPMWLYELETLRFIAVNSAAVNRYGYSREEFLAMRLTDIRPDSELPTLHATLKTRASFGPVSGIFVHRHKDGTLRNVEVTSDLVEVDGKTCSLVVANDVTDRLQAEARLREALELTSTLIRKAPVAIIGCDAELRTTRWNPTAERIFGWRADELLGKPMPVALECDDAEFFDRIHQEIETGRTVDGLEARRKRRDGSLVDVVLSSVLLRNAEGAVTERVAFLTDVSELKRLEEQFRHVQKMDAVGQLAGGIAHDFNNLLAVVSTNLRFVLEEKQLSDETREAVTDSCGAVERAISLTRQLLMFSRREVAQLEVLDLNGLLVDAERMLRRVIREDITLETRLGEDLPGVRADRGQLEQVLMNLVVNARDAMPSGGQLVVETCGVRLESPRDGVRAGDYVQLRVRDTGEGMSEATRQRIFEPFFTTKPVGKGTGLGLATVYGIVEQLGGAIEVESALGKGTTFTLLIPGAPTAPAQAVPIAPVETMPGGNETVLVVEDEAAVRGAIRRVLQRHGYQVAEAADGADALDLLASSTQEIGLVLTDLVMPRMGGRDLASRLRVLHPGLPILMMSAYDPDAAEHPLESSESPLAKPFRPAELLTRVRQAIDGGALNRHS